MFSCPRQTFSIIAMNWTSICQSLFQESDDVRMRQSDEIRMRYSDGIRIGHSDEIRIGQSDGIRIGQSVAN